MVAYPRSRDLLLNFAPPLYIYGMAEDTNFKFGMLGFCVVTRLQLDLVY